MTMWTCVLCSAPNDGADIAREGMQCSACGSTWRVRSIALSLLWGLGLPRRPVPEIAPDWSRRGIGVSDHVALAVALTARFDYVNTYYHRFPRVDLLAPPEELRGTLDFVICSDVLEHVPPPADRALRGLRDLLRPGGVAVVSVPIRSGDETDEYYPDLVDWSVADDGSVTWRDASGTERHVPDPEFHGGPGQTLAFRTWSGTDLGRRLVANGFDSVHPHISSGELGVPELAHPGVFVVKA